jgi:pyridoxamine 5'-phosphate oxidase
MEIAWWFAPSGDQFRITGHAYVFGRPDHPTSVSFLKEHASRLAPPAFAKDKKGDEEFNWEDERRRIFEKISPPIRASFVRPIPGTPLKAGERGDDSKDGGKEDYEPKDWPAELEMDGDKKLLEESYSNFALT